MPKLVIPKLGLNVVLLGGAGGFACRALTLKEDSTLSKIGFERNYSLVNPGLGFFRIFPLCSLVHFWALFHRLASRFG